LGDFMKETIGIIHPGEMGISVAASAQAGGNIVMWASQGRSPQTRARASAHSLVDAVTIENLCRSCSIIICVCPPHAAGESANQVMACSFKGLYVDVNAIAPQNTKQISEKMRDSGITFVDGGIIGGPAWKPDSTRLYLSGDEAKRLADCFTEGLLETEIISPEVGDASSLKMCYAALTKGTNALLCAVMGAAESLGVREHLQRQWERDEMGSTERNFQRVRRVTAKAWRFAGEMEEIASTFESAGVPAGFHNAAAEIYTRMEGFKEHKQLPQLEDVLSAIITKKEND
jgi:3-hydroxyisobutyrate dehydrogenase-like beta-hydroxyacid dehydrogenase